MISVFGSEMTDVEVDAVTNVLRSQWIGMGSQVQEFELEFAEDRGLGNFLMVDSGSNALYLAVKVLDLPPGSEIIVPSFTWVSCAQAVLLAGHKPVFCDVDLDSMNLTAELVSERISAKTGAVMVVHYAGLPAEIDEIIALGFPVIEDAAHSVDSYSAGRLCGSIGDVGIYSFDSVKNLAVGEGGGLTFKAASSWERAKGLRYCGISKSGFQAATSAGQGTSRWWEYNISEPFVKMLPTDIAGALGRVQLGRLGDLQARRQTIWEYYQSTFRGLSGIKVPVDAKNGDSHSFFTYAVQIGRRDEFAAFMLANDVYTTLRYHPLHMNGIYGQLEVRLPNSEQLNRTALSLPIHPRMSDSEVEKVADLTQQFITSSPA